MLGSIQYLGQKHDASGRLLTTQDRNSAVLVVFDVTCSGVTQVQVALMLLMNTSQWKIAGQTISRCQEEHFQVEPFTKTIGWKEPLETPAQRN